MESDGNLRREAYKQSEIIEDNEELTFLKSNGYNSVSYFGPKFIKDAYFGKFQYYDIYFIIDKTLVPTSKNFCITLLRKKTGKDVNYNGFNVVDKENDDIEDPDEYIKSNFPSIYDKYLELMSNSIYNILSNIKKGSDIVNGIDISDFDNLIYDIKYSPSKPGASQIILRFDEVSDFFKIFTDNDDELWFLTTIGNRRSGYEFEPWDSSREEWKGGYMFYNFTEENKEKIIEIYSYLNSGKGITMENLEENGETIARDLDKYFSTEVDNIISEYNELINECKYDTTVDLINGEFCDIFSNYGIFVKDDNCFWSYRTSVKILTTLFEIYDAKHMSVFELLQKINKESIHLDPNYYEYAYETYCNNKYNEIFSKRFNNYVSSKLDDILEEISTDEKFTSQEFINFKDNVFNKYKLGEWYPLPNDPDNEGKRFRIYKYDPEKQVVIVHYTPAQFKPMETRSYNYESFMNFLHNRELFERKVVNKGKKRYI